MGQTSGGMGDFTTSDRQRVQEVGGPTGGSVRVSLECRPPSVLLHHVGGSSSVGEGRTSSEVGIQVNVCKLALQHLPASRAAVASTALARGVSENAVMQVADWASVHTLFTNYICLIPAGALLPSTNDPSSVQNALLSLSSLYF